MESLLFVPQIISYRRASHALMMMMNAQTTHVMGLGNASTLTLKVVATSRQYPLWGMVILGLLLMVGAKLRFWIRFLQN